MNKKSIGSRLKRTLLKFNMLKSTIYKSIFVIIVLLVILLFTKIDLKPTNSILNTIRTTINYEYHVKDDTVMLYNKAKQVFNNTLETIPVFNTGEKLSSPIKGVVYRTFDHQIKTPGGTINNGGVEIRLENHMEPESIMDGLVTNIEKKDNKGYFITVVEDNIKIVYGYLQSSNLREGETVRKGDIIGEVGLNRDGNRYLRLELYIDNELVDPEKHIEF